MFLNLVVMVPLSLHFDSVFFDFVHSLDQVLSSLGFHESSLSKTLFLFEFDDSCLYQHSLLLCIFLLLHGFVHFILLVVGESAQATIQHFAFLSRALACHHLGGCAGAAGRIHEFRGRFFASL